MEVTVKSKRWLDIYRDGCFCYLLRDDFFRVMCIVSFNFNLNRVEAELIIQDNLQYLVPYKFHY